MRVTRRLIVPLVFFAMWAGAESASAATFHVSPTGSDVATGGPTDPFRTISKAAQVARGGDTVLVGGGTYAETVGIPISASGVAFRAEGTGRPVIDGEGVRPRGIVADAPTGVTIEGFEVRGQTEAGIYVNGRGTTITDNIVHDVDSGDEPYATGIKVFYGSRARIANNTVYDIGPGGESMGIWLLQTSNATVDSNTVYLVRKEGIRDWMGLDNRISNNRTFLTWAGISLNTSTGNEVVNNYAYDNAVGIVVKHQSSGPVMNYWKLTEAHMSRVWSNTIWRTSGTSLALGQSGEQFDYVDVRNNIMADAGLAYVHDIPELRGPNVTVDGNLYAPPENGRPTYIYKYGWRAADGIADFDEYRRQVGWDANGRVGHPRLVDPARGDLAYSQSSVAAAGGTNLSDGGHQLGALGLGPSPAVWNPYPMTAIDSSSHGPSWSLKRLQATTDDNQYSYWLTNTNQNEFVTYDFGTTRTFDHLVLDVFSHGDNHSIRGYRFEVSSDGDHWNTVLAGTNPDSEGSSYKYELPEPATARYLRFTLVDTFCQAYEPRTGCGEYFVFSDLRAGSMNGEPAGPELDVKVPRQTRSGVLSSRTLRTDVGCDQACSIAAKVFDGRTVVARGSVRTSSAEERPLKLKLTAAGRTRLKRGEPLRWVMRSKATSPTTGASTEVTRVRLPG